MSTFLAAEVRAGLEEGRKTALKRATRLRVQVGDERLPILKLDGAGFSMDIKDAPRLRGLIDIYDGPKHLYQALIVRCDEAAGELHYEFKRATRAEDRAPLDHVQDGPIIAGLLGAG